MGRAWLSLADMPRSRSALMSSLVSMSPLPSASYLGHAYQWSVRSTHASMSLTDQLACPLTGWLTDWLAYLEKASRMRLSMLVRASDVRRSGEAPPWYFSRSLTSFSNCGRVSEDVPAEA